MNFNGLTTTGKSYLIRCIASNKAVEFSKVEIGNGTQTSTINCENATALKSMKKTVPIISKQQVDNALTITIQISNESLEVGFYVKEIGIYVREDGVDKLYWYWYEDNATYLPDKNSPVNFEWDMVLAVSNVESTILNYTGKNLWLDQEWLAERTASLLEIDEMFEEDFIYDTLSLATESQIKNLFPTGLAMTGSAQFDLSSLSDDENKIINLKLLSLFNDLLQQRMNAENKALSDRITQLANTVSLGNQQISNELDSAIQSLTEVIATKAAANISITGTGALEGGGDLSSSRSISHKNTSGYKHIPSGGNNGQYLKYLSDGTATWVTPTAAELGLEPTTLDEIDNITLD